MYQRVNVWANRSWRHRNLKVAFPKGDDEQVEIAKRLSKCDGEANGRVGTCETTFPQNCPHARLTNGQEARLAPAGSGRFGIMKQYLTPSIDDLKLECVLMQAWKKTSAYLRSHSWYADTLGLDYQSLRIPHFIHDIQKRLHDPEGWYPDTHRFCTSAKEPTMEISP